MNKTFNCRVCDKEFIIEYDENNEILVNTYENIDSVICNNCLRGDV